MLLKPIGVCIRKDKKVKSLIGKKIGMTQIYDEKGKTVPVTVIQAGPCVVVDVKTVEQLTEQAIADAASAVNAAESAAQQIHADMHALEDRLAALQAQAASAEGAYTRAREVIGVNEQRIAEYKAWSDRDGREIHQTRQQLDEIGMQTESLAQKTALLEDGFEAAKTALEDAEKAFRESSAQMDELRRTLQEGRSESVACDRHATEVRDEIARLETQAREVLMKRERLASEVEQLEASSAAAEQTLAEVQARLETARAAEGDADGRARAADEALENAKQNLSILHPLPRVNEISVAVDDDPRACYFKQVLCGKYMRMALILKLLGV